MERRSTTDPARFHPGLIMFYPGFTQNQQTQPEPRRREGNIQPRLEEMWYANQSISTPQINGRHYFLPPQMSTGLLEINLTSRYAYNAMYCTPYAFGKGRNLANHVPNYTLSNINLLEMFTMSKTIGDINLSILGEKSATGCKVQPPNNHGVRKSRPNNDLALDRKCPALKEETPYEINDIRGCKRTIHVVNQEDSPLNLMENQSIKRTCTTEFQENISDCRPVKSDDDDDDIDVETVYDDAEIDETGDDPVETSDIVEVGISADEKDQSLEKVKLECNKICSV